MIVVLPGSGLIICAANQRMLDFMEEYLLARVLVRGLIDSRGQPMVLPPDEIRYLEGMESEKYRQGVTATGYFKED